MFNVETDASEGCDFGGFSEDDGFRTTDSRYSQSDEQRMTSQLFGIIAGDEQSNNNSNNSFNGGSDDGGNRGRR